MPPTTVTLPNLAAGWPIERRINPHFESVAADSLKWLESYNAFRPKAQASFNRCKFALLAALSYPLVDAEHLRLACDLMNWFFVFDEYTDVTNGDATREISDITIGALRDPYQPLHKECIVGEITRSLWSRVLQYSTPSSAARLRKSLEEYIEAVVVEAQEREVGHIRNIDDYLQLRRGSAGPRPSFFFYLLRIDIPEDVFSHPSVERLIETAMDLICLGNDVYSYNMERSRGIHGHNIVTAVQSERSLDVQEALDVVGDLFQETAQRYLDQMNNLPSFSPTVDRDLSGFAADMASWVRGLHEWSFESERYFGKDGLHVQQTRCITLAQAPIEILPVATLPMETQPQAQKSRLAFLDLASKLASCFKVRSSRAETQGPL